MTCMCLAHAFIFMIGVDELLDEVQWANDVIIVTQFGALITGL